jgi:hypothetical protein
VFKILKFDPALIWQKEITNLSHTQALQEWDGSPLKMLQLFSYPSLNLSSGKKD